MVRDGEVRQAQNEGGRRPIIFDEKLDCIGRGSFGEVFKGREKETDQMVALKLVDLEKADEEIDIIQRKIKVMSQISNPYVVRYHTSLMKGSTTKCRDAKLWQYLGVRL